MKNHPLLSMVLTALAVMLTACAGAPPVPDWKLNARGAVERATQAELEGNARVARVEWQRALEETRRTADPARMARLRLVQCAVQQSTLMLDACTDWEVGLTGLPDAGSILQAEQAYARYLAGAHTLEDLPLLPAAHRAIARLMLTSAPDNWASALQAVPDPLSRLVAASALLRAQQIDPGALAVAVDTASQMGWRKPLLGWLTLQAQVAEAAGDEAQAAWARQRLALLSAAAATRPSQTAD